MYAFSVATLLTLEAYDTLAEEQIFFHNRTADFVYVTMGVIESSGNTLPRSSLGLCMCVCVCSFVWVLAWLPMTLFPKHQI